MRPNAEILTELHQKLDSEIEAVKNQPAYDDPEEGQVAEYLFGKEHGLEIAIRIVETMLVYGTATPELTSGDASDSSSEE